MADPLNADHLAAQEGGYEPQRQSNWELELALPGADRETIKLSVVSSSLPPESSDEVELPYGNERRYVAGKTTFDSLPLVVNDFVDQETRAAILRWRRKVYNPATGAVGFAKDYKVDATITLWGPDGTMERECKVQGCWPQAVVPGTLDHGAGDPVQIEVTIRYDKADWLI